MKKGIFSLLLLLSSFGFAIADEGMWLPLLLEKLNEKDMQAMGLKITAKDIYDINHGSLKDAIVHFGGGCTAEVVSGEGLILTNHHCGYDEIQNHSTLDNDYLKDGFWAMSREEELPNPGLEVSFLIYMKDVTPAMMEGIQPQMNETARRKVLASNAQKIILEAEKDTHYKASIRAFYSGNEFYLFVFEIFSDVRLVGAPPSSIGKFGGDTDNWMWPRHTGDFSVFRIYAGKDNKPAAYDPGNVPFKPRHHIPISLKGVEKNDFTFVYGFPGSTQEYLPSEAIATITGLQNPIRISLRGKRLDIMDKYMTQSDLTRIQYASKHAGIANGWKKWIGESRGIARMNAVRIKQDYENRFQEWAGEGPYAELLPAFRKAYEPYNRLKISETWLAEAGFGIELIRFARSFESLVLESAKKEPDTANIHSLTKRLYQGADAFFKDYEPRIDQEIMETLLTSYQNAGPDVTVPDYLHQIILKNKGNIRRFTEKVFHSSLFVRKEQLLEMLANYRPSMASRIRKDPAYQMAVALTGFNTTDIQPGLRKLQLTLDSLQRIYMKAQMEMEPDRLFYPDANSTLRITYGKVDDYHPRDAVHYLHFTTLDGIMEKEDPAILDYEVHPRLKELWKSSDYGRYAAKDGKMHIAFTGTNHTTGGNSGSPVLNADGHLIGLNFDRNWEGTMSDLMYDPDMCRNITLDIRYCLFVIDKFAGAGHLIREMTLIE